MNQNKNEHITYFSEHTGHDAAASLKFFSYFTAPSLKMTDA